MIKRFHGLIYVSGYIIKIHRLHQNPCGGPLRAVICVLFLECLFYVVKTETANNPNNSHYFWSITKETWLFNSFNIFKQPNWDRWLANRRIFNVILRAQVDSLLSDRKHAATFLPELNWNNAYLIFLFFSQKNTWNLHYFSLYQNIKKKDSLCEHLKYNILLLRRMSSAKPNSNCDKNLLCFSSWNGINRAKNCHGTSLLSLIAIWREQGNKFTSYSVHDVRILQLNRANCAMKRRISSENRQHSMSHWAEAKM